jgi:16S rRNA (adenine1518-N6/adenine1519-N6)-dimethyltransferase
VVDPRPNKELGQHWLHDEEILQAIVSAAGVEQGSNVLEVGPGLGTLTSVLLEHGANVTAVEFDATLASQLPYRFNSENLQVIQHDILTFNLSTLPNDYIVVANIPYYLTSKLVRILCESLNPPSVAALLVQKEVAQRIAAQPGEMSLLSVSAQVYNEVHLGINVPAALFTPPPKVDSQVVVFTRRGTPLVGTDLRKTFFVVVKAGFSERRKKLRSSLSGGLRIEKSAADTLLHKASISPSARAQELSIDDWIRLSVAYANYNK